MKNLWAILLVLACAPVAAQTPLPPAAAAKVDYDADVRPILSQHCYSCHGIDAQQSGLRLDLRQNALRGGDYGPVITPGNSADSKLIRRLVGGDGGLQMPPTGPLSNDEIGILRAWIDQGPEFRTAIAPDAAPKPVDPKVAAVVTAVRSGDEAALDRLIAADPEIVNAKDAGSSTPLHHAAGFGTLASIATLLDKGADLNARNRLASTPLHWAVHDLAKVRLLVLRGANVNAKQIEGRTPVYQAAVLGGGRAVLQFLLENGGNPNIPSLIGNTPLGLAAGRGDTAAMLLLLDKGANVNAKNGAGATPLMAAAANGNPRAVQLLLDRGADPKAATKLGETALGNATLAGNPETVAMLLDRGVDVNTRNDRGYSPLMLAAGTDAFHPAIVKMLIAKGADTTFTGDYDETAQMLASKRGETEVTRLLGGVVKGSPANAAAPSHVAVSMESPARSIEKAMALLEKQSHNFIRIGGCNSCHAQDLPSAAAAIARDRGLSVPREISQLPASMMPSAERIMDLNVVAVAGVAWELFDQGMNRAPRTATTDAIVRFIKAMQTPEGNWSTNESRRPPMATGDYQTAALSIYSMKHYTPHSEKASTDAAVARAVAWLEQAKPSMTQDRAFHLLGLAWGGGSPEAIKTAAKALAAMQRADGGWNQLPEMTSDAYATGQALYALNHAAKMPVTNPVYDKGVSYLRRTQAPDGSWHVATRAIWLQPYFESGFPYGRDQFISAAGTAWATMALAPVVQAAAPASARKD